ncbi:hypothetical protein AWC38_SpisGene7384 [Stylophora pistillata]|uniref:Uncharacterized protein n=2 Tax=Stylophora pistillata TaxID=50429 RepID=A0A2B4SHJ4_STYPI|nr:hypothetical protein AWC38_SpisGene7384 [Stylophora pistillata]
MCAFLFGGDWFDYLSKDLFCPDLNMKRIVFILLANLLLVEGRKLSTWEDDKEGKPNRLAERKQRIYQNCRSNDDCEQFHCCFELTKSCFPERGEREACSPEAPCPCKPGLSCTLIGKYSGQSFYQCLNPNIQSDPDNMA